MLEYDRRLRHLAFFEELASSSEDSPAWKEASAGLVVLRLIDTWIDDGAAVVADDAWGARSVAGAIEEIDEGTPARAILLRVVAAVRENEADFRAVVTPLMAYGQSLEYDAKWTLAADVYDSVLAHLDPRSDSDASIAAHLRLGSCYRNLHRIPEAAAAFAAASDIAIAVGDMVGVLRARIGEARIAILRGNLPRAEEILDETIERAREDNLVDVRSRALHDRSEVANRRGQYELAIQLAYQALQLSPSPSERDRVLADIAGSFMDLGVVSAARDAYLVLSATAREQYVRWLSILNLLEIEVRTGAEVRFEQHRRSLTDADLPPFLATGLQLSVGRGYQRFGDLIRARHHLERSVAMAKEHGLNQLLFEAEETLLSLETTSAPEPVATEIPLDVIEVADAIRHLRETVGVS